jgi:hypothetical protein
MVDTVDGRPYFIAPKTISFKPAEPGPENHRYIDIISPPVTDAEIGRIREFYRTPDFIKKSAYRDFAKADEAKILRDLTMYRRIGFVEGASILNELSPLSLRIKDDPYYLELLGRVQKLTTSIPLRSDKARQENIDYRIISKEDYIRAIDEYQTKYLGYDATDKEDFIKIQSMNYMAIGFADACWMKGDFATALQAYEMAYWLEEDVPAAKNIPTKLTSILLTPSLGESVQIHGVNELGQSIIHTLSPEERQKALSDTLEVCRRFPQRATWVKDNFQAFVDRLSKT